jgi:hypothetical protein
MAYKNVSVRVAVDMKKFRSSMNNASREFGKFGKKMGRAAAGLSAAITLPATIIGKAAFEEFRAFEKQMARVKAISGATAEEFKSLQDSARSLGGSTAFTATEVASLQEEYAKLGFSTDEILKAQDSTLKLAFATGTDLAEAAMISGNALRAFGVDASRTADVQDVFAAATTNSALDMEKLRDSFSYVAPVAASAGLSIQDTSAALGVLADRGISGSKAGTAMRRILLEMSKAGLKGAEGFKEFAKRGMTVTDSYDAVGRSAVSALNILAKNGDALDDLSSKMYGAAGSLTEMEAIMMNTAEGAMKLFESSMSEAKMQIGQLVAQALVPLIKKVTHFIDVMNASDSPLKGMIVKFVGILAAAGPVLGILSAVSMALAALSGPVIGVVAALAGLVAIFSMTKEEWKGLDDMFGTSIFAQLGEDAVLIKEELIAAFTELGTELWGALKTIGSGLVVIWDKAIRPLFPVFKVIFNQILKNLKTVFGLFSRIFSSFELIFNGTWEGFFKGLARIMLAPLQFIQEIFFGSLSSLIGGVGKFAAVLGMTGIADGLADWSEGIQNFSDTASAAIDNLTGYTKAAKEAAEVTGGQITEETVTTNTTDPLLGSGGTGGGSGAGAEGNAKAMADAYKKALDKLKVDFNNTYTSIREAQLAGTYSAEEAADLIRQAEEQMLQDKLDLNNQYSKDVSDLYKQQADNAIAEQERIKAAEDLVNQAKKEARERNLEAAANAVSSIKTMLDSAMQNELNSVGDNEAAQEAIRRKYAKKRKAMALLEVAMNTALALSKITAQTGVGALALYGPTIAAGAAQAAAIQATPFANGGIVSGPTLSLTGEYPGAKSNPEVIAPLSKLKGMIGDVAGSGGGSTHVTGQFKVEGQDLVLALDRAQVNKSRRRR